MKFLSNFSHLEGKLIPGVYTTFDAFYKDLDKTFGDISNRLMPNHGKDYIFGPEHFAAALKLADAKKDNKKVKKIYLSKNQNIGMPFDSSINLSKLKKAIK